MKTPNYVRGTYNKKDRQTKVVNLKCSESIYTMVKQMSEHTGMNVNKLIRTLIEKEFNKEEKQ